jgi:MYXO-CTERM domain-containing protein
MRRSPLAFLLSGCLLLANAAMGEPRPLPPDVAEVNAKDFGAKGDGVTDDTAAIQAALSDGRHDGGDYHGLPLTVLLPKGIYLVSNTIQWIGCCASIVGEGRGETIIRLKDGASGFGSSSSPKAVLRTTTGNYSFRENIMSLTVDTGSGNPGAIGVSYHANNSGTLKHVEVRSGDGSGVAGIDMTEQWPGPCLVKDVSVQGFDVGIDVRHGEYGPTYEHIVLSGQKIAGIRNDGNVIAMRGLLSQNTVPAIRNIADHGYVILLDSRLSGGAATASAIDNQRGELFVRNIESSGYAQAISHRGTAVPGSSQSEWLSGAIYQLFESPQRTLGLPIAETPDFHDTNLANWVNAAPSSGQSLTSSLESAFASGKSTVYVPAGVWYFGATLSVPAHVRRIIGFGAVINDAPGVFRVEAASEHPLIIEQFGYGIEVEHAGPRTVVVRHGKMVYRDAPGAGDAFLEDLEGYLELRAPHNVWARQINTESLGEGATKIWNDGASFFLMGIKTEGVGPAIRTSGGGYTELFGTLIYPVESFTSAEREQAAFINDESSHSLMFAVSAYVENYQYYVEETRDGETRRLREEDTPGRTLPLFVGYKEPPPNSGSGGSGIPTGSGGSGVEPGAAGGSAGASGGMVGAGASGTDGGSGGLSSGSDGEHSSSGCGCRTARTPVGPSVALLLLGLLFSFRKRRHAR